MSTISPVSPIPSSQFHLFHPLSFIYSILYSVLSQNHSLHSIVPLPGPNPCAPPNSRAVAVIDRSGAGTLEVLSLEVLKEVVFRVQGLGF